MSEANISPEDVVSNAHKGVYSVSYAPSLLEVCNLLDNSESE